MKRALMLLAAGFALFALSACNGTVPTLTFPQQVAVVCGAANTELNTLQASGVFTGGAQTTLTKQIKPDVAAVCTAGTTVTVANLQNMMNATFSAVAAIVANSSLSSDDKTKAGLVLGTIEQGLSTAIALAPAATATATATAAPAPAASAPVVAAPAAASTPLAGAPLQ